MCCVCLRTFHRWGDLVFIVDVLPVGWCGSAFFTCVPTRMARLAFCVVGKPFKKNGLESPLIFVFILKGKTK